MIQHHPGAVHSHRAGRARACTSRAEQTCSTAGAVQRHGHGQHTARHLVAETPKHWPFITCHGAAPRRLLRWRLQPRLHMVTLGYCMLPFWAPQQKLLLQLSLARSSFAPAAHSMPHGYAQAWLAFILLYIFVLQLRVVICSVVSLRARARKRVPVTWSAFSQISRATPNCAAPKQGLLWFCSPAI